jgi:hypothetical protein
MHLPINVKSPNNISKWQMEFNSAFKGLNVTDQVSNPYKTTGNITVMHILIKNVQILQKYTAFFGINYRAEQIAKIIREFRY